MHTYFVLIKIESFSVAIDRADHKGSNWVQFFLFLGSFIYTFGSGVSIWQRPYGHFAAVQAATLGLCSHASPLYRGIYIQGAIANQ